MSSVHVEAAFIGFGFAYCFYGVLFRWDALRARYSPTGVAAWAGRILFVTSMLGWLVAVAVWLVQREISN